MITTKALRLTLIRVVRQKENEKEAYCMVKSKCV